MWSLQLVGEEIQEAHFFIFWVYWSSPKSNSCKKVITEQVNENTITYLQWKLVSLLEYYAWPQMVLSTPLLSNIGSLRWWVKCGTLTELVSKAFIQRRSTQRSITCNRENSHEPQYWAQFRGRQHQNNQNTNHQLLRDFKTPCTMKNHWCFQTVSNIKAKAISHALSLSSFLLQLDWKQWIIDVLNLAFSKFMQHFPATQRMVEKKIAAQKTWEQSRVKTILFR